MAQLPCKAQLQYETRFDGPLAPIISWHVSSRPQQAQRAQQCVTPDKVRVQPVAVCRLEEQHIEPLRPRKLSHQPQRLCCCLVCPACRAAARTPGAPPASAASRRLLPTCAAAEAALQAGSAAAAAKACGRQGLVGLPPRCAASAYSNRAGKGQVVGHSTCS